MSRQNDNSLHVRSQPEVEVEDWVPLFEQPMFEEPVFEEPAFVGASGAVAIWGDN